MSFVAGSMSAQVVVHDDINGSRSQAANQLSTTPNASSENLQKTQSQGSYDVDYLFIEKGGGIGMNLIFKNVILGATYRWGDKPEGVTENSAWGAYIGGHYRHWISKSFYVEGNAGLQYLHGTFEHRVETGTEDRYSPTLGHYTVTTHGTEKVSNGEFGLFLTPKIGYSFGKWSIAAGYRWDFNEFKFSKDYTNDYFTLGVSLLM